MRTFTIDSEQWIGRPRETVFAFFADAMNLEAITPPWLRFEIKTKSPIDMHQGTRIDYRLRLHGIPISWTSKIAVWDPPRSFVDEQVRGPYRFWRHEHTFEQNNSGTIVRDHVVYAVCGGRIIHRLLVARDVAEIFEFRRRKLSEIFKNL